MAAVNVLNALTQTEDTKQTSTKATALIDPFHKPTTFPRDLQITKNQ